MHARNLAPNTPQIYPFGMLMLGRGSGTLDYRYAYNGMELDIEPKGNGNSYTTEFRQYDPRLGRWFSQDPMAAQRSWVNPYNFVQNNPINRIDPLGNVDDWVQGNGTDDKGHGENDWHWVDDVKSPEEAKAKGYKGYAAPGTVVEGYNIEGNSKVGAVHLLDKGKSVYFPDAIDVVPLVPVEPEKFDDSYTLSFQMSTEMIPSDGYDVSNIQELRGNWNHFKEFSGYMAGFAAVASVAPAAIIALPFMGTGALASGTINAGVNLGAQLYANNGDWTKVDVLSTGVAFGSGFLPGSTALHVVRNSIVAGGVDAVVDLNASDGFRTVFGEKRKDVRLIASDFVFGSIGNAGGLSFGKNPFLLESIGTGVSVFPTTLGNKVVNDKIGN